jgi:Raf kinase inhibitor-like YbhB/YbcL family protein
MDFTLRSDAFETGATIPKAYTCDGADQSPPLSWRGVPSGSKSLALLVEDPDAPHGTFVHWVLFNVPSNTQELPAGGSHQTILASGARQGRNDFRRVGYGGPCPPRGSTHRYFFRLLALDTPLDLTPGATASEVRSAASGHVLGQTELMGTYGRG